MLTLLLAEVSNDTDHRRQAQSASNHHGTNEDHRHPKECSDKGQKAPHWESQESQDGDAGHDLQGHGDHGQRKHERGVVLDSVHVGDGLDVGSDLVGVGHALIGHVGNV